MKASPSTQEGPSIQAALASLEKKGFRGAFRALPDGRIQCLSCHAAQAAGDVALVDMVRVDVSTDPEDQSVVAGLRCGRCSALGTEVFAYGPAASPEDQATFSALRDERRR